MYMVCCEQETAFIGELYTEWFWSTALITADLYARLNGQRNKEIACNCSCTWFVAYSLSHLCLHVACANAVLFLNPWFYTWIFKMTLRAVLITAPLFFIYLWAVILLQSVLFQSMKAWRPFSIQSLVLMSFLRCSQRSAGQDMLQHCKSLGKSFRQQCLLDLVYM